MGDLIEFCHGGANTTWVGTGYRHASVCYEQMFALGSVAHLVMKSVMNFLKRMPDGMRSERSRVRVGSWLPQQGQKRIAYGHPDPYDVKYFELGNEQYNPLYPEQVKNMEERATGLGEHNIRPRESVCAYAYD